MDNGQIYRKTLKFSLMSVLFSIVSVVILVAIPVAAVIATGGQDELVQIGAGVVGLIVGIVVCVVLARFVGYIYRAGQIAMIAQGITTGSLPEDTYAAGKQAVKERFGTVAAYFALMAIIKGISQAITNGVSKATSALGGGNSTANTIGGIASAGIALVLEYLNYCCLGWVFAHKGESSFKSTCDGAVIYFQNWKTLLKNAGKIIGITAASLVVIGGVFFAIFFFAFSGSTYIAAAMSQLDGVLELDGGTSLVGIAVIAAVAIWSGIHSAFVKPYILISVMRKYIEAGMANPPKVDVYGKIAKLSKHFRKALGKAEEDGAVPQGTAASMPS